MRASLLLAQGAWVSALSAAPLALAQGMVAGAPIATPQTQSAIGDRGGDEGAFSGYRLSAPVRLSLEGSVFPKSVLFPNCMSREDDVGNSVGGIPKQYYSDLRLTPRLVLSGFTQLGCPVDAGIGGTLTYAVPINQSVQVVFSAGLYGAPGQLPLFGGLQAPWLGGLGSSSSFPITEAARVDLVWSTKAGHGYHLGIESLAGGLPGIRFGFSR